MGYKMGADHAMEISPSASGRGAPRSTEFTSSRRTSGLICGCGFTRMTSKSASFWSGVRSDAYLQTQTIRTSIESKRKHGNDSDVPLAEDEEGLVPEDGQLLRVAGSARLVRVGEADEVEDERVDDLVRQCVLLVEEHADEQGVCA